MYRLQVKAEKINIRNTPNDDATYANWVGDMKYGEVFTAIKLVKGKMVGSSDDWYADSLNRYVSSAWVYDVTNYQDWMINLMLAEIWNLHQEKGSSTKVAILDTGYNVNINDIVKGIVESKSFVKTKIGVEISINDTAGHGSHCSSLIASRNLNLICGCAPEAQLYMAKISSSVSVKNYSTIIEAIEWAISKNVDIISISYGGESDDSNLKTAISKAVNDHNILVIASIGDTFDKSANLPLYPALYDDCLAVGAVNNSFSIDPISVQSSKIDIYAPGSHILAYASGITPEEMTGTSQASAITAGVCALIISKYKKIKKNYTPADIKKLLLSNTDFTTDGTNKKVISPLKAFSKI